MANERNWDKLNMWRERLDQSNYHYRALHERMDERENLYNKDRKIRDIVPGDRNRDGTQLNATHVRNIIFENIEAQVSSSIPKPKVTPRRKKDEKLAETIEHFLRNELDRLPFEEMNDMAERTVPIQGAVGFRIDWDNSKRTHSTIGEVDVRIIHPKQIAPQPGVFTSVEDMDWIIIKNPTTKEAIRRKYGIDVSLESEEEPEVRTIEGGIFDDAVTEYIGFERNEDGGINRYCWVDDVELEDLEDYQARRQPVCKRCGRVRPMPGQIVSARRAGLPESQGPGDEPSRRAAGKMMAYGMAEAMLQGAGQEESQQGELPSLAAVPYDDSDPEPVEYNGGPCPWCGCNEFESKRQDYEEVMIPIRTAGGMEIPGATAGFGPDGSPVMKPTKVPYYKPDVYPIVLQKSVSVYGQLFGNSDVDQIADQQNTINRLESKINHRILDAGSVVATPANAHIRIDPEDTKIWYVENVQDLAMIKLLDFSGNLTNELAHLSNTYEEARQILGITDSFQGRTDTTAQSGKAKEFAAAQSAGRLESKRVMKNAAYARIFELIFKNWLAYGDEPRPITYKDTEGNTQYQEFNRYDFLERDADGQYFWNDQFLFSVDAAEPLASNREAMWQENRLNLQSGAFGDQSDPQTLILFWSKMEELHYPGAGQVKQVLEKRLQQQQQQLAMQKQMALQQQQQQMAMAQAQQRTQAQQVPDRGGRQQLDPRLLQAIDNAARQQAEADARQQAEADARRGGGGQ